MLSLCMAASHCVSLHICCTSPACSLLRHNSTWHHYAAFNATKFVHVPCPPGAAAHRPVPQALPAAAAGAGCAQVRLSAGAKGRGRGGGGVWGLTHQPAKARWLRERCIIGQAPVNYGWWSQGSQLRLHASINQDAARDSPLTSTHPSRSCLVPRDPRTCVGAQRGRPCARSAVHGGPRAAGARRRGAQPCRPPYGGKGWMVRGPAGWTSPGSRTPAVMLACLMGSSRAA
jgi:hypothetical protein